MTRYRVRKGLLGKAILQKEVFSPSFGAGYVDSSRKIRYWVDVKYENAPGIMQELKES